MGNQDRPTDAQRTRHATILGPSGERWEGLFHLGHSSGGGCLLSLSYGNQRVNASARDYFEALCEIRKQIERLGHTIRCYGASRNVFPSGMARDMGQGLGAYKLQPGRSADAADLVSIFDDGPDVDPVSVEAQAVFYQSWLASLGRWEK
ncbi:MAG: hypothetical protein MUF51_07370 [Vicinamibacteria bacterium]|jgi:hypothetical protein|nr:hypothetical protein [Vicinamibacteria bacterium]